MDFEREEHRRKGKGEACAAERESAGRRQRERIGAVNKAAAAVLANHGRSSAFERGVLAEAFSHRQLVANPFHEALVLTKC